MFQVNDVVVYSSQGVCEIIGIEDLKFGKETNPSEKKPSGKFSPAAITLPLFQSYRRFSPTKRNGKPKENGCICLTSIF